ncbi:FUSC family protein [Modestobacter sp. I12A-02628]|uniref:FUSC family protein n=1 Tax=Goekera deserti TaxID=2497753 RepID=A0A7K3WCT8_9ACTN|nr:FUSC family protein [Goekera deserti]MPQ97554.1 FUSC family protein [Goekera deserti]NDI47842.1 FUSC family protein [Goekera deserti]NEL53590.1 FUSC family protein [Goekera deserti]
MSAVALRAPAWLVDLVRTTPPAVPWRDVARFAVSLPAPLALAVLVDGGVDGASTALGAGVFGTTGALAATLAPQGGPLRTRLRRVAAGVGLGATGLVVGQAAGGSGWVPVLVVAALSAVAALVSSISAVASFGALQLLIYTALSSGLVTTLGPVAEVSFFLAGAAWATLLVLVQARTEQLDPDRSAVAAVFIAIADLLDRSGPDHLGPDGNPDERTEAARRALTGALNDAYDRVIHTRSRLAGRSRELSELAGVLNAAAPLVEGTVAAARAGVRPDPADVTAARSLAAAIDGSTELGWERPPPLGTGATQRRAVRHGVRLVWNVVGDPEERALAAVPLPRPGPRTRLRLLLDRTVADPDTRAFAVRLALCTGIAEVARQVLPIERPYWVLLTVAIVLKPDFGSVFTRAVHRGAGTLLGVLIGSALLAVVPRGGWILLAMAVAAGLMPWGRSANFGLFSVFQTPVVIMLLDLAAPGGADLVGARLVDTLIGCAIVLVFGYLLWPQTWRAPLDDALRQVTAALDTFLDRAFTGSAEDTRRARRATYRALTAVQTQLQRRLAEPPPISTRAAAWWPVIVQLERTADAVTEAVIALRAGEPAPDPAQVEVVRRAVRQLEEDVRAHRVPDDAELLAEGVLAAVAREVDTTRRLVRESAPGRWQVADPADRTP